MTDVLPTTVHNLERDDRSPCCDAQLVLVSPPNGYECRECYERYDLDDGPDQCQTVMDNGEVCGRDRPCQYHD
ncbi:hypothetical protein [Halorarum salinum]|uniref:Uncharacterized protein n=1 Tax=Halorarum salinum TaxID=2743089 RepID=A0A7D5LBX3_9EURY|nr:hypothetical protein [Halobaculum salinum]QLG62827.1 hypothetical protein HUG12_14260 [Halobaculum salinum]